MMSASPDILQSERAARPVNPIKPLLGIDYLVFSSHKTATQSIKKSLNKTGFVCKHCHHPNNLGLGRGDLRRLAHRYDESNARKLPIITVFREPIARHISSFFQTHGWKPISGKSNVLQEETIIHQLPVDALIERFRSEVSNRRLRGRHEALDMISKGLEIPIEDMHFDPRARIGVSEHDLACLHILRFDQLIGDFAPLLERVCGRPVRQSNKNVTDDKWYNDKYAAFKKALRMTEAEVAGVYEERRPLIDLMYEESFDEVLDAALRKYSRDAGRNIQIRARNL